MKQQFENASASIRGELESSKAEAAHLKQIIETLRAEFEKIKKENSEVTILFKQDILSTSTVLKIFLYYENKTKPSLSGPDRITYAKPFLTVA